MSSKLLMAISKIYCLSNVILQLWSWASCNLYVQWCGAWHVLANSFGFIYSWSIISTNYLTSDLCQNTVRQMNANVYTLLQVIFNIYELEASTESDKFDYFSSLWKKNYI